LIQESHSRLALCLAPRHRSRERCRLSTCQGVS
jgi:hypothetical protein